MDILNRLKSFALKLNCFRKYFLLLLFWLLYIIKCHGILADFCFDGNREGHRLNYPHILKRLRATSGIECILMCVNEDGCCRSVNYKKNYRYRNDEKENCELLHVTPAEEPGLLEVHIDYDHFVLLQPNRDSTKLNCPDFPCLNGGRCVGGCGNKTSVCNCPRSYTGKYCNKTCVDALRFRGNNIKEYGIFNGASETLTSFSACLWMKTTEDSDKKMLSYAYGDVANGLVIWLDSKLKIIFDPESGRSVQESSDILLSDGKYHHLCVTWQSSNGNFVVYVNGTVAFDFTVSGTSLPGGGYWVIGQDQDSFGGGFHAKDAFVGDLTEVHVWNRVLSTAEIQDLASSCAHDLIGNYVAYSDFEINGNVSTFQPPCCK